RRHDPALLALAGERHARGDLPVEQDPLDQGPGDDMQVLAMLDGRNIGARGALAQTVARRGLKVARPLLPRAIEVGIVGYALRDRRPNEGVGDGMRLRQIADGNRPVDAVPLVRAALLVLGALEIGQDILVGPSFVAEGGPTVIVFALAAHI